MFNFLNLMANDLTKTQKAYEILRDYKGENTYIIDLQNEVYVYKRLTLNELHIEYILRNHNTQPILLNKLIKVCNWYAEN